MSNELIWALWDMQIGVDSSLLVVISRLRTRDLSFRRSPKSKRHCDCIDRCDVCCFTRLFRHLLNWNGLRMFQISVMINLKTKFEGSSNRPCAKHNEEQRESPRVCEWQSKLLTWLFPRKHVPMTQKKC